MEVERKGCVDVTEIVSAGPAPGGSKNNFCIPKQILPNAARQSAAWTWQGEMASPKAKKAPPTVAKPKRPSPTTAAAKGGRAARAAARAQSRTRRPSLTTQGSSSSSAAGRDAGD